MKKIKRMEVKNTIDSTLNTVSLILSLIIIGIIIACMRLDVSAYVNAYVAIAGMIVLGILVRGFLHSRAKKLWFKRKKKKYFLAR
jgi:hypothetical protein